MTSGSLSKEMPKWSKHIEEELIALLKDWLKNKGKTQADLRESLNASSSRMPALIEVLQKEYSSGGIQKVAARLCLVEEYWSKNPQNNQISSESSDPFNQLDLLLEELKEDYDN